LAEPLSIGKKAPYVSTVGELSGGSWFEFTYTFKSVSIKPIEALILLCTLTLATSYILPVGRANFIPVTIS
jgi:uncharacterized membrane protein